MWATGRSSAGGVRRACEGARVHELPDHGPPWVDLGTWARFVAQVVVIPGRCHLWLAPPRDDGYGQFWVHGRPVRAPRYAWAAWHGPPGAVGVIRHPGDEPLCVPITRAAVETHLAAGSQLDNIIDRDIRGRGARCRHGLAGWAVDRRGMANRARILHLPLHAALAGGATPAELADVVAQVDADGATAPGQTAVF
jgi:hypothetical protein